MRKRVIRIGMQIARHCAARNRPVQPFFFCFILFFIFRSAPARNVRALNFIDQRPLRRINYFDPALVYQKTFYLVKNCSTNNEPRIEKRFSSMIITKAGMLFVALDPRKRIFIIIKTFGDY